MSEFWYEWSLVLRGNIVLCHVGRHKKRKKKINDKFLPSEIFLNKSVL